MKFSDKLYTDAVPTDAMLDSTLSPWRVAVPEPTRQTGQTGAISIAIVSRERGAKMRAAK